MQKSVLSGSYNLLNGVWTTESWTLKKYYGNNGVNGLVMSDWAPSQHVPAVKNGLDLEMAGNEIENELCH